MTHLAGKMDKMTCFRFHPEKRAEGMVLFEERNKVMLAISDLVDRRFQAIRDKDDALRDMIALQIEPLQAEEDRLTRQIIHPDLSFMAWEKERPNLVTDVGINSILDTFWRGSSYTQTVVMGLAGAGTKAAGDTQASHAGWSEQGGTNAPTYTGNRKAVTMGAASSKVSTSPQQTFAITSTGTVAGIFMNNGGSATKDNTTGTLVAAVDFTGGSEAVDNGDSLLVTYTFTGADT